MDIYIYIYIHRYMYMYMLFSAFQGVSGGTPKRDTKPNTLYTAYIVLIYPPKKKPR